jgi:hypothetical protein
MDAKQLSSESLVNLYQAARRHIPEYSTLLSYHGQTGQNLKSHLMWIILWAV